MRFESYEYDRKRYYSDHISIIHIILDKEISEQRKGNTTWKIEEDDISYKHAEKLSIIYQQIGDTEIAKKESFLEVLGLMLAQAKDKLNYNSTIGDYISGYASVLFFTLYKLGFIDYGLYCLQKSKLALSVIKPVLSLLEENINIFNNDDLGKILRLTSANNISDIDFLHDDVQKLKDLIINLRYEKLERKLEGIDTEISNDKIKVNEYLKNFGFEDKYNITLNKIDKFIVNEEYDNTVTPGGIIGIFREFFHEFYIDLALKIGEINGEENIPKSENCTTDIGHSTKYIQKEFNLNDDDIRLLKAYLGITNGKGAHKLLSEKKYFRLTRNIGIEISLLMLSKLEEYKIKKENS